MITTLLVQNMHIILTATTVVSKLVAHHACGCYVPIVVTTDGPPLSIDTQLHPALVGGFPTHQLHTSIDANICM